MKTTTQITEPGKAPHARIVSMSPKTQPKDRLGISTSDGLEIFRFSDIVHCAAEGNYCYIRSRTGREVFASKTLKAVEAVLPEGGFYRVHQSHVVCLGDICRIQNDCITMENGKSIPISRSKRAGLMECIQGLLAIV